MPACIYGVGRITHQRFDSNVNRLLTKFYNIIAKPLIFMQIFKTDYHERH